MRGGSDVVVGKTFDRLVAACRDMDDMEKLAYLKGTVLATYLVSRFSESFHGDLAYLLSQELGHLCSLIVKNKIKAGLSPEACRMAGLALQIITKWPRSSFTLHSRREGGNEYGQ